MGLKLPAIALLIAVSVAGLFHLAGETTPKIGEASGRPDGLAAPLHGFSVGYENQFACLGLEGAVYCGVLDDPLPPQKLGREGSLASMVRCSPTSPKVLIGNCNGDVELWDISGTARRIELGNVRSPVKSMAWTQQGRFAAVASPETGITLWDAGTGKQARTFSVSDGTIDWVDSAHRILVGRHCSQLTTWNLETGRRLATITVDGIADARLILSPTGKRVAIAQTNRRVALINLRTGKSLWTVELGHQVYSQPISSMVFSEDGESLAVSSSNRLYLIDARSGRILSDAMCHGGKGASRLCSLPGNQLLSTGHDGNLNWWSLPRLVPRQARPNPVLSTIKSPGLES